jgi:hypothetical protein
MLVAFILFILFLLICVTFYYNRKLQRSQQLEAELDKAIKEFEEHYLKNAKPLDPEYAELLSKNFWKLLL